MKYIIHLTLIFLVFFSGSSGESVEQGDTTLPVGVDTVQIKKYVQVKIDSFAKKKIEDIDIAVKRGIVDSVKDLPKVRGRKLWLRWVDKDERPNGHIYIWKWWYYTNKKDTVWYKMEVQRVK